jgi:hypothetical protein
MTVNGICHALWEEDEGTHLCGKPTDHGHWHLCVCGALLHTGRASLTDEQRHWRSVDCPACLARSGRPCVHRREHGSDIVMPAVHAERAAAAG